MVAVVVDANVALGWIEALDQGPDLHDYAAKLGRALANDEAYLIAPYVFHAECAHSLLKRSRSGGWPPGTVQDYAAMIESYRVVLHPEITPLLEHVDAAVKRHVQGFDLLYLDLALATGASIATKDRGLIAAAERVGVRVF
ncbi:type II toxin-antitoxin system VapC family toxin [Mitsuaria sp. TWR114]|jgi:predicted nucleic acid-binding protein|uniref:PIN domain-containing protein n=1 Tax=unclassified Roseateles TaxID=2626991 RepID=UPI0011BE99D9|nr:MULTISPECIES: PIN domain-containing protein [unclassified Roseateles]MBB3296226.1 putative nucleic acid-binding protein [Mitsuaria sp. BK041]MBB3365441.1 putative nucleic acid-binding protein [Mitsuaria sp. BK045]TXD92055.1 type II toxin-antitoxin system VapC family toxin [Mitsuaria sp. TWR114]